jgi:Fic family protein
MENVFEIPTLDGNDITVLGQIEAIRGSLSQVLRVPKRWQGTLRRAAQAKAIRGSNSIEGYQVSTEDAGAAVDAEPALTADAGTWAEILGYRRVLTYILNVATAPGFTFDEGIIKSMHFMLLEHDLSKSPGQYRSGPVYVTGEHGTAYTAPDAEIVPALMTALVEQIKTSDAPTLVKAAMAHLNLVMIHPFRDGNGRMGRALQTLVLGMDHVLEPAFSSIEEWLGVNTQDYYAVLAATGGGNWQPERSAKLWVRFNLRAHHMQAQTTQRRFTEANDQWSRIDELIAEAKLPDRAADALFDSWIGFRVTRPSYKTRAEVDDRQASRDLARMTDLGLLAAHGQTRGRYYTAGPLIIESRDLLRRTRKPLVDPYPNLKAEILGNS